MNRLHVTPNIRGCATSASAQLRHNQAYCLSMYIAHNSVDACRPYESNSDMVGSRYGCGVHMNLPPPLQTILFLVW